LTSNLMPWAIVFMILGYPALAQGNNAVSDTTSVVSVDSVRTIIQADSLVVRSAVSRVPRRSDAWFARDKVLHLSISAGLVGALYHGNRRVFDMSVGRSRWVASLSTLTVGALKEVRDRYHPKSTASLRDLAADSAGILIGVLLFSYVAQ
jgi:uncharacterized protein YfiM (DUF2279 family)